MGVHKPTMAAQRGFLIRLSEVEKSQPDSRLICSRIQFEGDRAILTGASAGQQQPVALDSPLDSIHEALESMSPVPLAVRNELAARYPERLDLADWWAELHYDIGRTSYLDDLDRSALYDEITLVDDGAEVTVRSVAKAARVTVKLLFEVGVGPVHVADEISHALFRVARGD